MPELIGRTVLALGVVAALTDAASAAMVMRQFDMGDPSDLHAVIITNPDLSVETWNQIESIAAEKAGAFPVQIYNEQTLGDLVTERCPGAGTDYIAGLPEAVKSLNPNLFTDTELTLDQPIEASGKGGTSVLLPYCLGSAAQRYVVRAGDTVSDIWEAQKDIEGGILDYDEFLKEYERLNGGQKVNTIFEDTTVFLPSSEITIPVFGDEVFTTIDEVNGIGKDVFAMPDVFGSFNQLEDDDPAKACAAESEIDPLQSAADRLWALTNAMLFNDELASSFRFVLKRDAVRLAVLDTGIRGFDQPLAKRMLRPLFRPENEREDVAFGAPAEDAAADHGTAVAFAAAGGPFFSVINPLIDAISVVPVNIYQTHCAQTNDGVCEGGVPVPQPNEIVTALPLLAEADNEIVAINISSTLSRRVPTFANYVGPDRSFLIITSAGNEGTTLERDSRAHPAVLGGDELSNVVTVAAVDLKNALLKGSNKSSEIVDIAAWGCAVPIVVYDPATEAFTSALVSGTSLAAPQVMFIAAMIERERHDRGPPLTPIDLKLRIVASADLVPDLFDEVKDGRVLNPEKAVMVHTDLVEMVGPEGPAKPKRPLLRGRIAFGTAAGDEVKFCGDVSVARNAILKVTQLDPVPPGRKRFVIYSGSGSPQDRFFHVDECDSINLKVFFEATREANDDPEEIEIDMKDIRDIVMATTPAWGPR